MATNWILLKDLAPELGLRDDHPDRWNVWGALGFRPSLINVKGKTGLVKRWAVTPEQAQRLRKLLASAAHIS
jgi:hypothetical protein